MHFQETYWGVDLHYSNGNKVINNKFWNNTYGGVLAFDKSPKNYKEKRHGPVGI